MNNENLIPPDKENYSEEFIKKLKEIKTEFDEFEKDLEVLVTNEMSKKQIKPWQDLYINEAYITKILPELQEKSKKILELEKRLSDYEYKPQPEVTPMVEASLLLALKQWDINIFKQIKLGIELAIYYFKKKKKDKKRYDK